MLTIVGVGASAGGLAAFTEFLHSLPVDTGMAFVLVQHLDPHHKSSLVDLLKQTTVMPVAEIEQNQKVEPNHIYIVPENKEVTIKNATLQLHDRANSRQQNLLINRFLVSLADDQQSNAIGVILSGTGSDGTLGLQAIKAAGGITFVQDDSAEYDSMPDSAIRASTADFTLSASDIAHRLSDVNHHHAQLRSSNPLSDSPLETPDFSHILQLLEDRTGVAMTSYKTAMLQRRAQRRLAVLNLSDFSKYATYLEDNPAESDILYQDMLINVTSFFRDKPMLDFFADDVLPELMAKINTGADNALRIWVAGCASGEEAYSLAIICNEFLQTHPNNISVKIFATDLNPLAIEQARRGVYPIDALEKISKERREHYFIDIGRENYRVKDSLRQMCIFAVHNLLVDPPFSSMDFVSCCNVMIYLQPPAQQKLLATFHYALKPEGILTLGPSESIGAARSLFNPLDKKLKIFRRKQAPSPQHFDTKSRPSSKPTTVLPTLAHISNPDKQDITTIADNVLLSQFTTPSVLIDSNLDIIEFYGITSPYLVSSSGKASLNLLKMARSGLVLHLRKAIRHVKEENEPYKTTIHVKLDAAAKTKQIKLEVLPLKHGDYSELYILVVFGPESPAPSVADNDKHSPSDSPLSNQAIDIAKDNQIIQLEHELTAQQEETKRISEDHEVTVEELQLANEEVRSSNEELQSLNEELETSSEELASTNEELLSMNQTLRASNESLASARDYAEAVISTVRHPLLVLTPDLKIVTANTSFLRAFKVSEKATIGSFLYDLGNGEWQIPKLRKLLEDVSSQNYHFQDFLINHNFRDIGARVMLLDARRIAHEKVPEDFILLAIEDITERRQTEQALRASSDQLRFMAESMPQKVFTATPEGTINYLNPQWMEFTGLAFDEIQKSGWTQFVHPDELEETVEGWKNAVSSGKFFQTEHRFRRSDGVYHWHLSRADALRDNNEKIIMWTGSSTDIEDLKRSKKREIKLEQSTTVLRNQRDQLIVLNKAKQEFINIASHQLRTPATGVKQFVGMLLEGYAGPISLEQRSYLEQATRSNDRLLRIIDDLLKVARIDAENLVLDQVSTDLVRLTESVLNEQTPYFVERGQYVKFTHTKSSIVVSIDSPKIRMVLENLINNARKYTPDGKTIIVKLDITSTDVIIFVKDPGVGIDESDLSRLFQKFSRIHNDRSIEVGGSGLGLYVAKKIIDLHKGSIAVSSVLGKGTTFTVTLPLNTVDTPQIA